MARDVLPGRARDENEFEGKLKRRGVAEAVELKTLEILRHKPRPMNWGSGDKSGPTEDPRYSVKKRK